MTVVELFSQSGFLSLLGLIFLAIIISVIRKNRKIKTREADMNTGKSGPAPVSTPALNTVNSDIIAAIAAALNEYRKKN